MCCPPPLCPKHTRKCFNVPPAEPQLHRDGAGANQAARRAPSLHAAAGSAAAIGLEVSSGSGLDDELHAFDVLAVPGAVGRAKGGRTAERGFWCCVVLDLWVFTPLGTGTPCGPLALAAGARNMGNLSQRRRRIVRLLQRSRVFAGGMCSWAVVLGRPLPICCSHTGWEEILHGAVR